VIQAYSYYSSSKLDFKDKYNKMGLLDNIGSISGGVDKALGGISGKLNNLTSVAKGVLCLPTMIAGLVSSIPNIIGGVVGGINTALTNIVSTAAATAEAAIQNAVGEITGRITDVTTKVNALLGDVQNAVSQVVGFVDYLKASVGDVKSFVNDKENCNFAGAALGKCIVQQTLNNLTKKDLRDASAGALDISRLTNKVTSVGNVDNVITRSADKQLAQLRRVQKVMKVSGK